MALAGGLMLDGCHYSHPTRDYPAGHAADAAVVVWLRDGTRWEGVAQPTSAGWRASDGRLWPWAAIDEVAEVDRVQGFFEGLGLGSGTGIAAGLAVGAITAREPDCDAYPDADCTQSNVALRSIAFGVGGGILGGLVGGLVGLGRGSRTIYVAPAVAPDAGAALGVSARF